MDVNEDLIRHVAKVSRLNLTDEEVKKFVPELKEIINSFSDLDKIDTKNVKPSFQPVDLMNHTREDIVKMSLSQNEALKNSEQKKDGFFMGPRAV